MKSRVKPRILEAAASLFAERGYWETTTRQIARRARTTEGSIYRLFGNKRELFRRALGAAPRPRRGGKKRVAGGTGGFLVFVWVGALSDFMKR